MNTKINNYINSMLSQSRRKTAPAFVLYITDNRDISLYTAYLDTSTQMFGIYTASESFSTSIQNRTVESIAADLDASNFPAKIVPISRGIKYNSLDYFRIGTDVEMAGTTRVLSNFTDRTSDGGFIFRLKKHSVKYLEESILRLLPPYPTSSLYPWYARIQNGIVSKKYKGINYQFYVSEFNDQEWSVEYKKPYKTIYGERAIVINDDALKVSRAPIYYRNNNIFVDVDGMIFSSRNIKDVDMWNGIIYTNEILPTNKSIYVTYTAKEDSFLYKQFNLNPTYKHNFNNLNTVTLFYMIPAIGDNGIRNSKTVRHVNAASLRSAINLLPDLDYPILLLGAIIVQSIKNKDGISVLDTRTRGGGLYEEDLASYLKEFEELNFLWDVNLWDGVPYPGNAAAIFSVPKEKYELFEVKDLKDRLTKFLAPGIVPILNQIDNLVYQQSSYTNRLPTIYNGAFANSDYWTDINTIIINNFTGLSIEAAPTFNIDNSILSLVPDEYALQKYLKSLAPSIIKYKKRISEDGTNYSTWQEVRNTFKNNQEGFLFTDNLLLGDSDVYTQYKDIEVSVAHSTQYDLLENIYSKVKSVFISNESLYVSGLKTKYFNNLLSGYTSDITWSGINKFDENLPLLYTDNVYSGHIVDVANGIINSLYTDASGNTFPRLFNGSSFAMPTNLACWTKTAKYLYDVYVHTSGTSYLSGFNAILNSVVNLNPYQSNIEDILLNNSGTYTIPNKYYSVSGLWQLAPFNVFNQSGQYAEVNLSLTNIEDYLDGAYVFAHSSDSNFSYYGAFAAYSAGIHFGPANLNGNFSNTWYYNGSPFTVSPFYMFDFFGKVIAKNHYLINKINSIVSDNLQIYTSEAYNQINSTAMTYIEDMLKSCGYLHPDIMYLARSIASTNSSLAEMIFVQVLKYMIDLNGRFINSPGFMYKNSNITNSFNNAVVLETVADLIPYSNVAKNYAELIYKQLDYLYNRNYGFAASILSNESDDGTIFNGLIYLYNKWLTY